MRPLRFGVEIFPYHSPLHNPTLQFEEDIDLAVHLDRLGFDEMWFGEHHSTGWETIASPELMAVAVAERTKHIKIGLGVTSIPYHHPFMLADRIIQLDHITRGRVIWGMGTGSVAQDASMLGLDTRELRRMSEEGVEAIARLLEYGDPVTRKTDWFVMNEAALQLRPYSRDLDIRVAGMISPSGPRLAGRHGHGLFQFAAMGEGVLSNTWNVWEETAQEYGQVASRDRWSLLHHIYIAETEEQAREDVKWNLRGVFESLQSTTPLIRGDVPSDHDGLVDELNNLMVIGTPEMAIERLETLQRQSGGVGTVIIGNLEAAEPEKVKKSFELFARHVMPHFNGQKDLRLQAVARKEAFGENASRLAEAQANAAAEYEAHKAVRDIKV
ncbi:limonene 1,2-monooxygenase [Williamsia limnetica]|uniref:Limonene 1,2-monooxygenase n=1 Tax=Williamsia limnetica TaxID=882452 RepID=A0A318REI3_WILLI|nr:LLM class flavin-dependent oxidoreductase [Williamsia limnetica]PYE12461.1 limonene 1,2-monooxygenase [Williamsia limnetica]